MDLSINTQSFLPTVAPTDPSVPTAEQLAQYRREFRDAHRLVHFDAIGPVLLDRHWAARYTEIQAVFDLLSATGTGRMLLADIKACIQKGERILLGAGGGVDAHAADRCGGWTLQTRDDGIRWDLLRYARPLLAGQRDADAYTSVIHSVAAVRNFAIHRLDPDLPLPAPDDVERAFLAELAVRAAPAVDPFHSGVPFVTSLASCDTRRLPRWPGPLTFDGLGGLMPAWLTEQAIDARDDLTEVLAVVRRTDMGRRLLNELQVYGRASAVLVVHCSRNGNHGLRHRDGTGFWGFDASWLSLRASSTALTRIERQASGAMVELLRARTLLQTQLGFLGTEAAMPAAQQLFERELLESRRQRAPGKSGESPPAIRQPSDAPAVGSMPVSPAQGAAKPTSVPAPPLPPRASRRSAQAHGSPPLSPAVASSPVPLSAASLPAFPGAAVSARAIAVPDDTAPVLDLGMAGHTRGSADSETGSADASPRRPGPSSRTGRWLRNARSLATSLGQLVMPSSRSPSPVRPEPDVYAAPIARDDASGHRA
ncbi:hypothetical protein [Bordetella bronchialis]|uniref:Uncharacterized protein n=1 Tax=Bordetella bronchialis TaxID=463025 RepID=A0A193FSY4_9BORD|nr:hypothetical protein [Bordetella bronchialis]ANN70433.1 hypothetical protein BAU08_02990 [Bordetella bronchialis]